MTTACRAIDCKGSSPSGRLFCSRCERFIPVEIWLAIDDHADAWRSVPGENLQLFIAWCWQRLIALAAHEIARRRECKRRGLDPDDPNGLPWVLTAAGELARARLHHRERKAA